MTSFVGPSTSQPSLSETSQQVVYQNNKSQGNQNPAYSVQSSPGTVTAILAPGTQHTTANASHSVQIHQSSVQPQVFIFSLFQVFAKNVLKSNIFRDHF